MPYIGNLDAERDWGHAKDYVEMQWLMLQQDEAIDYVIATGQKRSVRALIEKVFELIGVKIAWDGDGLKEIGLIKQTTKNCPPHLSKGDVLLELMKITSDHLKLINSWRFKLRKKEVRLDTKNKL